MCDLGRDLVQNQIIDVIGNSIIRDNIVKEVLSTKWFSILSDEASSGTDQFMSIVYLRSRDEKPICGEG